MMRYTLPIHVATAAFALSAALAPGQGAPSYMESPGVAMSGVGTYRIQDITSDGQTIVGTYSTGVNSARPFIATTPVSASASILLVGRVFLRRRR